jgi:REP element-mobilizing transposase RayT
MVLAFHSIFSAYGFWLPNDPRGSWSDFIRQWQLLRFGPATKTTQRHSVARAEHDILARLAAKQALQLPPVAFTGRQALAVGRGFAQACAEAGFAIHACSILPEHVHLVVARHQRRIERVISHLKSRATKCLAAEGLHPFAGRPASDAPLPSPWGRNGWNVYLNTREGILRAIRYVQDNPLKEGKPVQRWSFVTPYAYEETNAV